MADRGDTHYSVSGLNAWFAFASLALLLSFVWMVLDDHQRPWKEYQREFRQIEVAQALDASNTHIVRVLFQMLPESGVVNPRHLRRGVSSPDARDPDRTVW